MYDTLIFSIGGILLIKDQRDQRPLTYPCRLLSAMMDKNDKMNEWVWRNCALAKNGRNLDEPAQLSQKDWHSVSKVFKNGPNFPILRSKDKPCNPAGPDPDWGSWQAPAFKCWWPSAWWNKVCAGWKGCGPFVVEEHDWFLAYRVSFFPRFFPWMLPEEDSVLIGFHWTVFKEGVTWSSATCLYIIDYVPVVGDFAHAALMLSSSLNIPVRYAALLDSSHEEWLSDSLMQSLTDQLLAGQVQPPNGITIPAADPPPEHMDQKPDPPQMKKMTFIKVPNGHSNDVWGMEYWVEYSSTFTMFLLYVFVCFHPCPPRWMVKLLESRFPIRFKNSGIPTQFMAPNSGLGWKRSMRNFPNQKKRGPNEMRRQRQEPPIPPTKCRKLGQNQLTCRCLGHCFGRRGRSLRKQCCKGSTSSTFPTLILSSRLGPSLWPMLVNRKFLDIKNCYGSPKKTPNFTPNSMSAYEYIYICTYIYRIWDI